MAVMLALFIPLFMILLALFVNLGLLIHQKIRLQTAVDVGSYAAAASLARDLNEIAHLNENIQELYDGDSSSEEWEYQWEDSFMNGSGEKIFNDQMNVHFFANKYQNLYYQVQDRIDEINEDAMKNAYAFAEKSAKYTYYNGRDQLVEENPNDFQLFSLHDNQGGKMISYQTYTDTQSFSYVEVEASGGNPWDPYEGHCEDCISKTVNVPLEKTSHVVFAARAEANVGFVNLMPDFFRVNSANYQGNQIRLSAYAASQPYGGSVYYFSKNYRATLIPIGDYAGEGDFWH